jgi:pimeloyl-ACP methyl ester carboxylesterase
VRWRVVRYDARGHGRSPAPDDPAAYTPEAFVADLARVLDRVGATRAVVGGLSMGASTALRFALAHPKRVRGLALAAFPPPAATPGSFGAVAAAFADAIERDGLDAAGARFVWGPATGLDPEAARFVRAGFLEHPPHGLAHTLRGFLAAPPPEPAGRVAAPTLVVVGADDRLSVEPSRRLAAAIPGARLVVVPGAGHVVNLAAPAAFNAALTEFLAGLPAD